MSALNKLVAFFRMFSRDKAHPSLLQMVRRRLDIWNDRRAGLDFLQVIKPEDLGLDENVVHRGSPSGNRYLRNLLNDLNIRPGDAILDVGCAKGSAMRTMLEFPFSHVDGIEISKTLAEIATRNFQHLGKSNASVFNANATSFEGYGRYDFYYFYNPFPEVVMSEVMAQLQKQRGAGREAIVIYNAPKCHAIVVRHGFTAMRDYPDQWGNGIRVYSSQPANSRLAAKAPIHAY